MKLSRSIRTALAILIIAVLSVSLAACGSKGSSANTQKSAENAGVGDVGAFLQAPFPDYTFEPLGSLGEIGVLALGAVITLALGYGIGEIVKRRT